MTAKRLIFDSEGLIRYANRLKIVVNKSFILEFKDRYNC